MAIKWIEEGATFGSSPSMVRRVGYEETGRTATTATVKVYLELKLNHATSATFYGFPMTWTVGGNSAGSIKGSEKWYGGQSYRRFTYSYKKTGLSSGGGSFSLAIAVTSSGGGNCSYSKTYSIGYSTFNTAPTWSSTARLAIRENSSSGKLLTNAISGTENSVKFAENVGKLYVSWDAGSDANNNISKYELYSQIDDGAWSKIYSGTARSYTHSIGSGASTQGKKYDYFVRAVDSYGLQSNNLDGLQIQKNQLTPATLSVSGSLKFDTASISASFSGAKNSMGGGTFTYKLSSPQITVYNGAVTASPVTITILRDGGAAPSNPYIKFADLKALTQGSSWKGSFSLELTTTNSYGSSAKKSASVAVDLRKNPVAPSTVSMGGRHTVAGLLTYISNLSTASVSWSGASDYLGGALTYDVLYSLDNSSWTTAVSNTSALSASFKVPVVTKASELYTKVIAKTSFGYTSASGVRTVPLHYYNPPTITFDEPLRASSSFTVKVTSEVNTSIPNVTIASRSFTGFSGQAQTFTTSPYTLVDSGLTEESVYTLTVTVQDNSGLTGATATNSIKVSASIPIFSVREKGVGVNCVNSGAEGAKLKVNGGTLISTAKAPENGKALLEVGTGVDGNAISTGNTFLGYSHEGLLSNYLRGSGKTYIDTLGGSAFRALAEFSSGISMKGTPISDISTVTLSGRHVIFEGTNPAVMARDGYLVLRSEQSMIYIQGTEVRATQPTSASTYIPVRASAFPVGSSINYKQNIAPLPYPEAKRLLDNTDVYSYHLNSNIELGIFDKPKIGMISEMSPPELRDEDGIDPYSAISTLWKVVKEQQNQIEALQKQVSTLEGVINTTLIQHNL